MIYCIPQRGYAVTIGSPKDVARSKRQYVGGQRERERILSYCEFATDTLLAAVRANGKLKAGVERSMNIEKDHERFPRGGGRKRANGKLKAGVERSMNIEKDHE